MSIDTGKAPTGMHKLSSPQRYQLFADQARELAIVFMDEAGIIVEWSAGAEKLFGWTQRDAIG